MIGSLGLLVLTPSLIACSNDDSDASAAGPGSVADGSSESRDGSSQDPLAPKPLAEPVTVRVGQVFSGVETHMTVLLADYFGEFEKENLNVEIETIPATSFLPLLASGEIDVSPNALTASLVNAIADGLDIALVSGAGNFPPESEQGFYVTDQLVPDSGEFDVCSIEGKTVSFGSAGLAASATWPFKVATEECGFGFGDIQVSTLDGGDLLAALESGALDVGFVRDPLWVDVQEGDYASLVIPWSIVGNATTAGYLMGPFRHEEPDAAAAFMRAMQRTTREYLQGDYRNDPEVREAMLEVLDVPEEVIESGFNLDFPVDMEFNTELVDALQSIWVEAELVTVDEPLPVDDLVDGEPLANAQP